MKLRSGGLFSTDKKDCKTSCTSDSVSNCKKYCSKAINAEAVKDKLGKLQEEIEKLKKDEMLAQHDAEKRKSAISTDRFTRKYEEKQEGKVEKHFHFGGVKRKSRKAIKSRKNTRKRGGKSWSEYFWAKKPNLAACEASCQKETHSSCEKICDNASIKTADSKMQGELQQSEKEIATLKDRIAFLKGVY
jgi:hypothetical protein